MPVYQLILNLDGAIEGEARGEPLYRVTQILRKIWGVANVRWVDYPLRYDETDLFSAKCPGHTELVCLLAAIFGDIWREQP